MIIVSKYVQAQKEYSTPLNFWGSIGNKGSIIKPGNMSIWTKKSVIVRVKWFSLRIWSITRSVVVGTIHRPGWTRIDCKQRIQTNGSQWCAHKCNNSLELTSGMPSLGGFCTGFTISRGLNSVWETFNFSVVSVLVSWFSSTVLLSVLASTIANSCGWWATLCLRKKTTRITLKMTRTMKMPHKIPNTRPNKMWSLSENLQAKLFQSRSK